MKMDRPDSGPSRSSILGLDALTFLMADVRDGVGPYLSIYLKGALHWQSGEIGIAMAVSSITAAICQIPAGLLVDAVRAKRLLVVISGLVVCLPKLAVIARTHHLAGFRRVISSWQCGDVADGWTGTCEEASWR
jgi:MFS-type transporter involved in bile tolerance (Atg22 family)